MVDGTVTYGPAKTESTRDGCSRSNREPSSIFTGVTMAEVSTYVAAAKQGLQNVVPVDVQNLLVELAEVTKVIAAVPSTHPLAVTASARKSTILTLITTHA